MKKKTKKLIKKAFINIISSVLLFSTLYAMLIYGILHATTIY